jgi:hypothetical protein
MKYIKEYKDIEWEFDEEETNVPDEFEGHEDFYNFLVNNDILDKWINNFEKAVTWRNKEEIHDFLNIIDKSYYFDLAFFWKDTEEGHDFWNKINKKWCKLKMVCIFQSINI